SGIPITTGFTAGQLTLNLFGAIQNTSGITVNQSGTLLLDNTQLNSTNRVSDTAPVTLNTGTLNFQAMSNPGIASSETLGPVTLGTGQSTVVVGYVTIAAPAGATSVLTVPNLVRNAGATVNFQSNSAALGSASNQVVLTQVNGAAPAGSLV